MGPAVLLVAVACGFGAAQGNPESRAATETRADTAGQESRPWFVPDSRPAFPLERLGILFGSRTYGVYEDGVKRGYVTESFRHDEDVQGGPRRLTYKRTRHFADSLLAPGASTLTAEFETLPPFVLRSLRENKGTAFTQGPSGTRLGASGMGIIDDEVRKSSEVPFVDLVLADAAGARWMLAGSPRVGMVFEPREVEAHQLGLHMAFDEKVDRVFRPEKHKATLVSVDEHSQNERYRVDVETDEGLIDHQVYDSSTWMVRSREVGIDGTVRELISESAELAATPFDASGRYRAILRFTRPAEGPEVIEALDIVLPMKLVGLIAPRSVGPVKTLVNGTAQVTLLAGERELTDVDRSTWAAQAAAQSDSIIAWAKQAIGSATDVREKVSKLRLALQALPDLDAWASAARLADGANALGIPARVVEGHAITDERGDAMQPHAWVEALEGDRAIAVDPLTGRIPAPPVRVTWLPFTPASRSALTEVSLPVGIKSKKVRDVGVPDLRGMSLFFGRVGRDYKPTVAWIRREFAEERRDDPRTRWGEPDEIDLPVSLPVGSYYQYGRLSTFIEALRYIAARNRWDREDIEILRVVAEYVKQMPDPVVVDVASSRPDDARAAARSIGKWMERELRNPAVYARLVSVAFEFGPYVGLKLGPDVKPVRSLETFKAGGLDLTLGGATIEGIPHVVLRAERDGQFVWARQICATKRYPIGDKPKLREVVDLAAAGFRININACGPTLIYLGPDGSFQFYYRAP